MVSDQVSGDVSILFNDASHSFTTQERYRAGQGPFDVNTGPNGATVVSQLQTVGVVAADFTGDGSTDLVALNANTDSFSLLRAAGGGSLIDPQTADTYLVGPGAVQVLAGDFLHNGRQDLAILTTAADGSQARVLVFPNNGDGTFGAPIVSAAGEGATGFSFVPGDGRPARPLPGRQCLRRLPDPDRRRQPGAFIVDRGNLNGKPLAVGTDRRRPDRSWWWPTRTRTRSRSTSRSSASHVGQQPASSSSAHSDQQHPALAGARRRSSWST